MVFAFCFDCINIVATHTADMRESNQKNGTRKEDIMEKPHFPRIDTETPTKEQLFDKKQNKFNRVCYEWFMENTVHTYFNLTQKLAERTYAYTKKLIGKTAILAGTSTAVALIALCLAIKALNVEN